MFPSDIPDRLRGDSLLHACGDVSVSGTLTGWNSSFAPRMWRCFYVATEITLNNGVCSTHVEMFLTSLYQAVDDPGLLHACGDVSYTIGDVWGWAKFAPRMWRCFLLLAPAHLSTPVCSTHVEMFLPHHVTIWLILRLLHACGDVSGQWAQGQQTARFAPRMWRCF